MIRHTAGLLGLVFILFGSALFAQLNKANKLYQQNMYSDAIVYYTKVLKREPQNIVAMQNIANAYRKVKDYENAEKYYAQAVTLAPNNKENLLYYGQSLKNNNKHKEAKVQFAKYVKSNPSSLLGKLFLQSIEDIKEWKEQPPQFEVDNVENINSKNADFCPIVYNDGIVFVSERGLDLVNGNNSNFDNKPYLSVFYAEKDKSYKKPKRFSNTINSQYHDGPVCISNNQIYFTRVSKEEKGKGFTNTMKIYFAQLDKNNWKNIKPFKYNSKEYSVAHPWLSEDGKQLFFASDMPSGYGGMDIYMCNITDNGWSKPQNLGANINTPGNEVFPYYKSKTLYFSSDGLPGYGGLDVFSTVKNKEWEKPKNLRFPLNSTKDDFGLFYIDGENGFFSSDREGGLGSDDIYSFKYLGETQEKTQITGVFEYQNLPVAGAGISLLDEDDNELQSVKTDENGKFIFKDLDMDENYVLRINEEDEGLLQDAKLYLTNSKGEKVIKANRIADGKYVFKALPYDTYDNLPLIEEEDQTLFNVSIFGQVYKELPGDYSGGMDVWVVDDNGNIVAKAKTGPSGKFTFDKLSPDEQYMFMLSEDDENLKIIILNENGELVEATNRLIDGKYKYVRLDGDENVLTLINEIDEVIKISENDNFVISNILYEYRSAEITSSAAKELDKLVLILKKNKNIGLTLSSHTDSKGGESYNLELSQKRAEIAANYIFNKGISKRRIKAQGFGETKPIAPNKNKDGSDNPEGRAKNRRTEFKVFKF